MEQVGQVVRERRKDLELSQDELAWMSDVSRTTIRNIEANRVEEARSWADIETVLGWEPGSLELIHKGLVPNGILPTDATHIMVKAASRRAVGPLHSQRPITAAIGLRARNSAMNTAL